MFVVFYPLPRDLRFYRNIYVETFLVKYMYLLKELKCKRNFMKQKFKYIHSKTNWSKKETTIGQPKENILNVYKI